MLRFIFGDQFEYLRCRKKSLRKILTEFETEMKMLAAEYEKACRQTDWMPAEELDALEKKISAMKDSIQAIRDDIRFTRKQIWKEVFRA